MVETARRKAHQNNYHKMLAENKRGKKIYIGDVVSEAEMSGQV